MVHCNILWFIHTRNMTPTLSIWRVAGCLPFSSKSLVVGDFSLDSNETTSTDLAPEDRPLVVLSVFSAVSFSLSLLTPYVLIVLVDSSTLKLVLLLAAIASTLT